VRVAVALDKIRQRVGNAELRGIAAEATRQAMFIVIERRTARVEEIYIKEKLKVAFLAPCR